MHTTRNTRQKAVIARITRQGKLYQQNFPLSQHKTWEKAEKAAQKWVKDTLPTLPPSARRAGRMTSRNTSGVVGVWRASTTVRKANGKNYRYNRWVARWPGCPLRGGVFWGAAEYGEDGAFVLACLTREMETADRDEVLAKYEKVAKTKKFQSYLEKRKGD